MSHATQALSRTLLDIPDDTPISLVWLRRYDDTGAIGMHVLTYSMDSEAPVGHRTVGLFALEDARSALTEFYNLYQVTQRVMVPFAERPEPLKAYIRRQVIPLEWKSMTDHELGVRLEICHGANRHVYARSRVATVKAVR